MDSIFVTNFTYIDWIIAIVYLGFTVAKGVWVNRYVGKLADFIVAGRGLMLHLAVATMTGTEIGLVTIMYNAQEGFAKGISAYVIGICWFAGMLLVGLTGFIIYPLREYEVMTIPEYYEKRFGRRSRVLGGTILALAGILNMGLFLQAGGRFMTAVLGVGTGFGLKIVMTVMLLLVLLYTAFGGMISVVITDFAQFVVLGSMMVIATIWAVNDVGWSDIVNSSLAQHGQRGINPLATDGYGWVYVAWMLYMGVAAGSLWATATVRALAARSPRTAQKLYAWSSVTFLARVVIPVTWGAAALAFISARPELSSAFLEGSDTLSGQYAMPVFFARIFPTGFLGILAAGMMAGFMSTHDSYLLCWASVITQDIVAPLYRLDARGRRVAGMVIGLVSSLAAAGIVLGILSLLGVPIEVGGAIGAAIGVVCGLWVGRRVPQALQAPDLPERGRFLITRISIVAIGLFLLIWGLWYEAPMTLWTYMAITGTIYLAGAFSCIAFGLYWKKATETGAIAALLAGLLATFALFNWEDRGYELLTEKNISMAAVVLAAAAMVIGSLLSQNGRTDPADDESEDDEATIPQQTDSRGD